MIAMAMYKVRYLTCPASSGIRISGADPALMTPAADSAGGLPEVALLPVIEPNGYINHPRRGRISDRAEPNQTALDC